MCQVSEDPAYSAAPLSQRQTHKTETVSSAIKVQQYHGLLFEHAAHS